jgi:threonyl-tRNA synthetase
LLDFQAPLRKGGKIKILKLKDDTPEVKRFYRHSMSHVLAQAVKRLYPKVKLAIGPATKDGFYYDFDTDRPFTPDDLEKISAEMKKIIKEHHTFERIEMDAKQALEKIKTQDEPYKLELIQEIIDRGENVSFYQDGEFLDMCAGPHVRFTDQVKNFQLLDVAGAYWKGDEKNTMLQRIYGTAF